MKAQKQLWLSQVAYGMDARTLSASANAMGVWPFGCSLNKCPGCTSPHTWSEEGAREARHVHVNTLLELARQRDVGALVVSGGEPSDQADAVLALATGFKTTFPDREAVLYSGLRYSRLQRDFPDLVKAFDVVVAGPFVQHLAANQPLLGSSNQALVLQTGLAQRLYADWQHWSAPRLQVASRVVDEQRIELVTVGIPRSAKTAAAQDTFPVQWSGRQVG
jgi:anaerobic ribonucleoside-triphosphate reductase activating protein